MQGWMPLLWNGSGTFSAYDLYPRENVKAAHPLPGTKALINRLPGSSSQREEESPHYLMDYEGYGFQADE